MSALGQLLGRAYANKYGGKYDVPLLGYVPPDDGEDDLLMSSTLGQTTAPPVVPPDPTGAPSWVRTLANSLQYAPGVAPIIGALQYAEKGLEQPSSNPVVETARTYALPVAKELRNFAQGLDPAQQVTDLATYGVNLGREKIFGLPKVESPQLSTHADEASSPLDASGNYNVGFAGNVLGGLAQMVGALVAGGAVGGEMSGATMATKLKDVPYLGRAVGGLTEKLIPWLGESTLGTALGTGVGNSAVNLLHEARPLLEDKKKLGTVLEETALAMPVGMLYAGASSAAYPLMRRILGEVAVNAGGGGIQSLPSVISGEMPLLPNSNNPMEIMGSYTGNVALQGIVGGMLPLAGAGMQKLGKLAEKLSPKPVEVPPVEVPPIEVPPTQGETAVTPPAATQPTSTLSEAQAVQQKIIETEAQQAAIKNFVKTNFKGAKVRKELGLGRSADEIAENLTRMTETDPLVAQAMKDFESGTITQEEFIASLGRKTEAPVAPIEQQQEVPITEQPHTVVQPVEPKDNSMVFEDTIPAEVVETAPLPKQEAEVPPRTAIPTEELQPEHIGTMSKEELQQHFNTHQDELPQTGNPIADIAPTTEAMPKPVETATVSPVQEHVQSSVEGNPDVRVKDGVEYKRPKPFVEFDEGGKPIPNPNIVIGKETNVVYHSRKEPAYYIIHPAEYGVPSHKRGKENYYNYVGNPQAKLGQSAIDYVEGLKKTWTPENTMGFDESAFQNTPPHLRATGEPIQGNSRTELTQLIYEDPTSEQAVQIVPFMKGNAERYGVNTPEQLAAIDTIHNPMVSRVSNISPEQAVELSNIHQDEAAWKKSPTDMSTLRLAKISEAQEKRIFTYLENELSKPGNEGKTFKQLLSDGTYSQSEAAQILSGDNQKMMEQYLDSVDGNMGVAALEHDIRSMIFKRDPETIKRFNKLPNKYKDAINANLANILRLGDDPVARDFKEAMAGLFEYNKTGKSNKNVDNWLHQMDMEYRLNSDKYSPGAQELMKLIDAESPSTIKNVLQEYASGKINRERGDDMFGSEPIPYEKYLEGARRKVKKLANSGVNLNSTIAPFAGSAVSSVVSEQLDDDKEYFGVKGTTIKNILQVMGVGLGAIAAVHISGGGKLLKVLTKRGEEVTMQPLPEGTKIKDGFYSPMEKRLREVKKDKDSAAAWLSYIGKKDEAEYTGLKSLLEKLPPRQQVSKADLLDHLDKNRITLVEKVLSDDFESDLPDTHYASHQLGGDKDGYEERLIALNSDSKLYSNPLHFYGEPNVLVHTRSNIREAEGKKTLFVEESQSDWGQAGREEGFRQEGGKSDWEIADEKYAEFMDKMKEKYGRDWMDSMTAEEFQEETRLIDMRESFDYSISASPTGIANAPFVKETAAWTKLGIKYDLIRAVKEDVDRIAWTTGEQQNQRWSLSQKADRLSYDPDLQSFFAHKRGATVANEQHIPPDKLPKYIGKELAEKLLAQPKSRLGLHVLEGKEIEVGGAGMKAYYGSPKEEKLGIYGEVMESLFGKGTVKKMEVETGSPQFHFPTERKIVTKEDIANYSHGLSEYEKDSVLQFVQNINGQVKAGHNLSDIFGHYTPDAVLPPKLQHRLENLYGGELRPATTTQHYVEMTPAIRAQVQAGMSLFNMGAALAVPDNDEPIYPGASVTNRQMRMLLASASIAGIVTHPTMLPMLRKLKISMPETKLREVKPIEQTAIPGYGDKKLPVAHLDKSDVSTLVGKARADGITDELLAHHLAFLDGKPNSPEYVDRAQVALLGNAADDKAETAAADYLLKSTLHAHNGNGELPVMSERLHELVTSTIDNSADGVMPKSDKTIYPTTEAAEIGHATEMMQGRERVLPATPPEAQPKVIEQVHEPSNNWQQDLYLTASGDDPLLKSALDKVNARKLLTDEEVQAFKKYVAETDTWDKAITDASKDVKFETIAQMQESIKDPARKLAFTKYVQTKLDDLAMDSGVADIIAANKLDIAEPLPNAKPRTADLESNLPPLPPGTLQTVHELGVNKHVRRTAVAIGTSYMASNVLFDDNKTYGGMSGATAKAVFALTVGGLLFNAGSIRNYLGSKLMPLAQRGRYLDRLRPENIQAHDYRNVIKASGLKVGSPEYKAAIKIKEDELAQIDKGISKWGTSIVSLGGLAAKGNKYANFLEDVRISAEKSGRFQKGDINKLEAVFEKYSHTDRERVHFAMAAYDKELGMIRAMEGTKAEKELKRLQTLEALEKKWFGTPATAKAKEAFDIAQEIAQHGRQIDIEKMLYEKFSTSWKDLPKEIANAEKGETVAKAKLKEMTEIYKTLTAPKDKAKARNEIEQQNNIAAGLRLKAEHLKYMQSLPGLSKDYHYLPHFWDKRGQIKYAVYEQEGSDVVAEFHKFTTEKEASVWLARFKREKKEGLHDYPDPQRIATTPKGGVSSKVIKINELLDLAFGEASTKILDKDKIISSLQSLPEWKTMDDLQKKAIVDRMTESVSVEQLRHIFNEIWKPRVVNLEKRKMIGGYLDANPDLYLTGKYTPHDSKTIKEWVFGGLDHITSGGRIGLEKAALFNAALEQKEYLVKNGFGMSNYMDWLNKNVLESLQPGLNKAQPLSGKAAKIRSGLAISQLALNILHGTKNYGLGSVSTIAEGGIQSNIFKSAYYFAMAHPQVAFDAISNPKLRAVWDKLKRLDIGETQYYNHVMMKEVANNAKLKGLMLPSILSESANNKLAGLTFARIALDKGKTIDEAVDFALKMRQRTQYSFTPWMTTRVERQIRQSFGGFGSTALTLMGAALRGAEHAGAIYFRGVKNPKSAAIPAMAFLTMTTMFGGLYADAFAGTAINIVELVDSLAGESDDTSLTKENHVEMWQRKFGDYAEKFGVERTKAEKLYLSVMRGFASTATNINFTQDNNLLGLLQPIFFSEGSGIIKALMGLTKDKTFEENVGNFMKLTAIGNRVGRAALQLQEGHALDSKGNAVSDAPYRPQDAAVETVFGRPSNVSFASKMKGQGGGDIRDEYSQNKYINSLYALPGLTVGKEKNQQQFNELSQNAQKIRRDLQKQYDATAPKREEDRRAIMKWANQNKALVNWIDRNGGAEVEGNLTAPSKNALQNSIEKWYTAQAAKQVLPGARFSERKPATKVAIEKLITTGVKKAKSREQKAEYRKLMLGLKPVEQ